MVISHTLNLINNEQGHNTNNEPIAKLFQGKKFAFVSTLMKNGSSQISPTWIDIEKNHGYSILVECLERSQISDIHN
jgi:hypothetical protein